ncbi:GPP34 family phosphoprotein [Streptomyces sp. NPDC096057]|uniref:GPP34 family phosphoprotein n=1 Tax=Streptomyces sp. NPDC096057 TaxID=3155543 RepID=UPI0033325600
MTTARDLTLVVLGLPPGSPVEHGDLSLALAGAEAVDLLESGALTLDGDIVVPGPPTATGDRLLDEAVATLVRRPPYETVTAWLWRRGSELAAVYVDDLERDGSIGRPAGHGRWPRSGRSALADSPVRRAADRRRASGEPVLTTLLTTVTGVGEENPALDPERPLGDAVATVLSVVGDVVTELEAARLRRNVENAAFDNIWRA